MKARRFDFVLHQRRSAGCGRILLVFVLGLLAGCATVTFKRGASPEAMAADERACRDATTDETAYVDCMRKRGWFTTSGSAAPAKTESPVPEAQAPSARPPGAATNEAARPLPVAASPPPATANPSATPTAAPPAGAIDPLARVNVASWWKLGGSAADLDRAIDACVAELGAAHRPDPGAKVVTAGLNHCLRNAGWYAFGTSAAP